MTDEVKVLSDDEVQRVWANNKIGELIISPEIDALCATVRALRADYALVDNYVAEIKRELGLPPNTVLGVTLENYKERVTAPLREQLAQKSEEIRYAAALAEKKAADEQREIQRALKFKQERDELQSQLAQVTQERDELRKEASELRDEVRMLDHT